MATKALCQTCDFVKQKYVLTLIYRAAQKREETASLIVVHMGLSLKVQHSASKVFYQL